MPSHLDLIVTTKADLRQMVREAVADALGDQVGPTPELMGAAELGARVGVHARTIRNWVLRGCPHIKAGRKLRFREPDVLRWLEEQGS